MKHTVINQARRAGGALAAVAAFAAFGIGTAQAQSFFRADISINSVGFLDCSFKETGLGAGAAVDYTCGAEAVGWFTQCFIKNKAVSNSPPMLHVGKNVTTEQTLFATNRGTLNASILTAYPTVEEEFGPEPCSEFSGGHGQGEVEVVETITAIKWCESSLVDTTNAVTGAAESELFLKMERNGTGTLPDCSSLLASPPIP